MKLFYVIPNEGYAFSLDPKLFNVATSRAKLYTIIIADERILKYQLMDNNVYSYLSLLKDEFSYRFDVHSLYNNYHKTAELNFINDNRWKIKQLYPGLENIIDQLMDNNIQIDEEGDVALTDKDDMVIAEAGMLLREYHIAIDPVDNESKKILERAGYKVISSHEFSLDLLKQ